jgi:glutamate 5-kinase
MYSKIRAAAEASKSGTETWLVRGDVSAVLLQAAENHSIGTVIEAQKQRRKKRRTSK